MNTVDHATTVLATVWPHLSAIAHRIIDDADRADDAVHNAWLRWQRAEHTAGTDPAGFLAPTTHRLAVDVIKSARRRPPVSTGRPRRGTAGAEPQTEAERTEAAELAVTLLRENLSPAELAAYVLRKAFDCPSPQITTIVQLGASRAGYLIRSAVEGLAAGRRPTAKQSSTHLLRAFLAASRSGNLADLDDLLAADLADQPTRWPTRRKR